MERHALRYSKGYAAKKGYTFWEKDFDAMAYKTMLRQLISKWGIMTVDMQMAFEQDVDIIQNDDGSTTVVSGYDDSPAPADYTDAAVDAPETSIEEPTSVPAYERQVSLSDL